MTGVQTCALPISKKLLEITGCDGVAIARATMGEPWLSKQINDYLYYGRFQAEPSFEERVKIAMIHLDELIKIKGEIVGIREARRHLINYTKGFPSAASIRAQIGQIDSKEKAKNLLSGLKEENLCKVN